MVDVKIIESIGSRLKVKIGQKCNKKKQTNKSVTKKKNTCMHTDRM